MLTEYNIVENGNESNILQQLFFKVITFCSWKRGARQ